ncbi:hypothetical protein J2W42_005838 [Rhizobium tibeticum]|uniref:Uncharacterized protein n=1 Tax=Rhizobium tibeticum TaxID=501024 RepID=A0A1H8NX85_9HYPH|nr:hypothetical protein [Rhizobium tibeticum]MDP9812967.1 hypothetical protein [Rhizobium tibeticum]SEH99773.1 hypothetical protein RTCCBAU85039_3584 [Rhizobium tibeticum]SEO34249.1 hypothetical protein SAMN05216228_1015125 [Rhizobium tibeticum]
MKLLHDWLDDKLEELGQAGYENDTSMFEKHADLLRAQAEADGYDASDLNELCGGDIAAFLRDRQAAMNEANMADKLADDDA